MNKIELDMNHPTHALSRTNPKGVDFIGQCSHCGEKDLSAEAVGWMCPALLAKYLHEILEVD